MKKLILLTIVATFALTGCAGKNLITHGEVDNERYISNEAGYTVTAPPNWHPTITAPAPDIESKIESKLKRRREVGYITKSSGAGYIMIETYWLTWAGKPILPIDITWDSNGPNKLRSVCEDVHYREKNKLKEKFTNYTFECEKLKAKSFCVLWEPCLESTKEMVSSRQGKNILLEKVYIVGPDISPGSLKNMPKDAHGWRINFTLMSPPDEYLQNKIAFEEVINSMQQGY